MIDAKERAAKMVELQGRLGLPLPPGLPAFVLEDGIARLQDLQREGGCEERVGSFRNWVSEVLRCFGFSIEEEGIS